MHIFDGPDIMKTIGIIGGMGPESTVDYYRQITSEFNAIGSGLDYPEIIVYSANLNTLLELVEKRQWSGLSEWLLEKISSVHRAGAEFAAIASNTPHIVFEDIRSKSPIPLLSIVEATCSEAREKGGSRIGLMGTRLTMESDFYKTPFIAQKMSVIVPTEPEQQLIEQKLYSEIELGIFKDSTRNELLAIVKRMVEEDRIDSLILGCTELPLILTESRFGIPFLNTTAIHCKRIVEYCLQD